VLYGHPGVFADPGHEAVRRVRAAGLPARLLPAVSSLDCLFADLRLDPGRAGLQCYEATYFFLTLPPVDPRAMLVLLQVGMIGETGGAATPAVEPRFRLLLEALTALYAPDRPAILYEASAYAGAPFVAERFLLGNPDPPAPTLLATLCVPALEPAAARAEQRSRLELSAR
jgi:hypothetical protein